MARQGLLFFREVDGADKIWLELNRQDIPSHHKTQGGSWRLPACG